ncbi:MAG: hypothetical protein M3Y69_10395, partial [Verrucomicrobiota bacterium]|nr:hypothetical protein [Verrucomicrobiota bacterium]
PNFLRLSTFTVAAVSVATLLPALLLAPMAEGGSSRDHEGVMAEGSNARLANISTRLAVGRGDNVLIGGFIVTGNQPKKILFRGLGPSLPVIGNLSDPTLELHDSSGAVVAVSDNWRDTQEEELRATQIPPRNDHESGIVRTLQPGAYTAVLAGKGGTTGVGLVEFYDLDQAADSKLANIATRGFVDRDDNVLIGGTIVTGTGFANVLFRALGPSLGGVANPLQNPTLELHDSQGSVIATNDNWQDSQAAEIQATTIPPPNPLEAAILRQLPPDAYTAIVRGKDNTTGVALIEAYQLN